LRQFWLFLPLRKSKKARLNKVCGRALWESVSLAHRTEKWIPVFGDNPMRKQEVHRTEKWIPVFGNNPMRKQKARSGASESD
jgi:hypothetical protein